MPCWPLWLRGTTAEWSYCLSPSFGRLCVSSGTTKASPQGDSLQARPSLGAPDPVYEVHGVFSKRVLPPTSRAGGKDKSNSLCFESPLDNPNQQLKRKLHMPTVQVLIDCLWLLGAALPAQMRNFHLNYKSIFMYQLTFLKCYRYF